MSSKRCLQSLLLSFTVLFCPGSLEEATNHRDPGPCLPLSLPEHTQSSEEGLKLDNSMSGSSCLRMDAWMEGCRRDADILKKTNSCTFFHTIKKRLGLKLQALLPPAANRC